MADPSPLSAETRVNLRGLNTFGLPAVAAHLVRVREAADVRRVVDDPVFGTLSKFILGGGSNVVFTHDLPGLVLKVEVPGRRLVEARDDAWIVEFGAGENWHEVVAWSLQQGWPGLENLALIPGTVGAAPVQNIGAYGVELADRFESLEAVDLMTGRTVTLDGAACRFGYRDSVFKQHLAGRSVITRVRLRLPRPWQPVLGYLDLQRRVAETGVTDSRLPRRRSSIPASALTLRSSFSAISRGKTSTSFTSTIDQIGFSGDAFGSW